MDSYLLKLIYYSSIWWFNFYFSSTNIYIIFSTSLLLWSTLFSNLIIININLNWSKISVCHLMLVIIKWLRGISFIIFISLHSILFNIWTGIVHILLKPIRILSYRIFWFFIELINLFDSVIEFLLNRNLTRLICRRILILVISWRIFRHIIVLFCWLL
mgnify:CR=1 FL=1